VTPERFNQIVDEIFDRCKATLVDRASMYARGDRLSNFKRAAEFANTDAIFALEGMAVKHEVSIHDYIDDIDSDILHTREEWLEKICDTINYLGPLLLALLEDTDSIELAREWPIRPTANKPITLDHNAT